LNEEARLAGGHGSAYFCDCVARREVGWMGLFTLYLAHNEMSGLIYLSPDLSFDRAYLNATLALQTLVPLSEPLPVGLGAALLDGLQSRLVRFATRTNRWSGHPSFEALVQLSRRELRPLAGNLQYASLDRIHSGDYPCGLAGQAIHDVPVSLPGQGELAELQRLLAGRLLRPVEVARALGWNREERRLNWTIQALCLAGRVQLLPALFPLRGRLVRCQRCGWEGIPRPVSCKDCGRPDCCECPECAIMGGLSLCETLYTAVLPGDNAETAGGGEKPASGQGLLSGLFRLFLPPAAGTANGRSTTCRPLYWQAHGDTLTWAHHPEAGWGDRAGGSKPAGSLKGQSRPSRRSGRFQLEVEFTPPQRAAVEALLKFGASPAPDGRCLVWAACGAGKTEVSYPLIGQALGWGSTVLFATPRRDVVLEVAPRLERAFGKEKVAALYGGSGSRAREAPLVVATTHQTLRWHRHFDLVILDEGDAFPYPGSRMLHYGVEQAGRCGGKLVYLTATPASWMLDQIQHDGVDIIKIPARPHGFPLPEPRFLKLQPFRVRGRVATIHPEVLNLVKATVEQFQAPLFLFVPGVEQTALVGQALRNAAGKPPLDNFKPSWIEWSHASDQHRDRKRERFFNGEYPVLVTTTIMERGVTLPRVHVIVLWADQAGVFAAPTLVQIAGRCGRNPSYPTGEVWFVGPGVSREMEEALGQIRALNAEAARLGYLRPDYLEALRELMRDEARDRPARRFS